MSRAPALAALEAAASSQRPRSPPWAVLAALWHLRVLAALPLLVPRAVLHLGTLPLAQVPPPAQRFVPARAALGCPCCRHKQCVQNNFWGLQVAVSRASRAVGRRLAVLWAVGWAAGRRLPLPATANFTNSHRLQSLKNSICRLQISECLATAHIGQRLPCDGCACCLGSVRERARATSVYHLNTKATYISIMNCFKADTAGTSSAAQVSTLQAKEEAVHHQRTQGK